MGIQGIAVIGGMLFLLFFSGKLVDAAIRSVKNSDDDRRGPGNIAWYAFVLMAGAGFGAAAARWYWKSDSFADYGPAAILIAPLMVLVILVSGAILGAAMLALLGSARGTGGRLIAAAGASLLLFFTLIAPMRQTAMIERQKAQAAELATYRARLADLQAEKEKTPHAPLGTIPGMLELRRDDAGIHVTNRGQRSLVIGIALVLSRDRELELCDLGVEEKECTPGSSGCSYRLAKDGTPIAVAGVKTYSHRPLFAPGQTRTFAYQKCRNRFSDAPIEFNVWDVHEKRYIFKSDSAFLPTH